MANSSITLNELLNCLESLEDKDIFLDVRTPLEFSEGRIPGSINVSHEDVGDEENLALLKKYKKIFVYCRAGRRAVIACQILEKAGFDNLVCVPEDGTELWAELGYPFED